MNGGYLIVSKDDTNLYEKLNKALTLGKPVLWYEDENTCYFIDTITKSGADIILTKGGKTITIESDGDITEVGDLLTILDNIVDKDGNKRFIETNGTPSTKTGLTITYNKCSLSGTHIMFVIAGNIANTTAILTNDVRCKFDLPQWILDKIFPVWDSSRVDIKAFPLIADDWSTQSLQFVMTKLSNGIEIGNSAAVTLTADRSFRIQFDLLIDNE